ncbi:MAG: acyl-CoA synthetase [Myxococcota bacterium]
MTTLTTFASKNPDKPALIYAAASEGGSEWVETYGELEERSRRIGVLMRNLGLEAGDCVAVLMANDDEFMDVFWAAHRIGLYFTPVNWHLQVDEVEYIVDNCDAKALVAHQRFGEIAAKATASNSRLVKRICIGGDTAGFESLESLLANVPKEAELGDEFEGSIMLYSSGTTGRPKGVRRPLAKVPAGDPAANIVTIAMAAMFGMVEDDHYLTPAPLYHAAPLVYTAAQQRIGATSVIMRQFDPEEALRMIDRHNITTSQWVPTHFRRLLRLPQEVKQKYDLSSLRLAVHAAAPCPIPLKEQMIEWWGDAIVEYYAGTEGGGTLIRADDWMNHKGSVGRHLASGTIHILDDEGQAIIEAGVEGNIYFEAPDNEANRFRYHKDDEKTANTYRGKLFTRGDVGYLDADGYLFLTDRQSHMIISGGMNIYPQETEDLLIMHPKVDDVAVIGVPNAEMGEEVKAVVIPVDGREAGPALEQELIDYCRKGIAHYKCPRSVDFVVELPRTETGKMAKRKLRDRYWKDVNGRI